MRRPRARARLGLLGGAALLTLAAAQPSGDQGQSQDQGAPKSILPEGMFGAPPAPRPVPVAPAPVGNPVTGNGPAAPAESAPSTSAGLANPTNDANAPSLGQPGPALTAVNPLDTAAPTADLSAVGLIGPTEGGFARTVFAGSNGRFLAALMARMTAPVASRWAHIALVRALASTAPPPPGIHPADWIAARVTLLMRLGEGDVAHALAERVSIDRYTPKLYQAAFDASLAATDPAGLCPIALTGQSLSKRVVWRLATAMCAGFAGDDIGAAQGFDNLRSGEADATDPFDITLAERLASSAGAGTRTANVEWGEAGSVNLYRLGLGVASGALLPDALLRALPAPAAGWLFRAANAPDATRAAVALSAGAQGIVGSGELAAFYAALAGDPSSGGVGGDTAAHLRAAYAGSPADRLAAMRALWDANPGADRYGALVLTSGAAINLPPNKRFAAYAPDLMASAMAGGRADLAMRWWPVADAEGGRARDLAWAYAAVAGGAEVSRGRLEAWAKAARGEGTDAGAADHHARLLVAALTGLGRGGDLGGQYRSAPLADAWTAAIDGAAAAGGAGEVVLLAATGLQSGWVDVPPAHLEHILAALVRAGRIGDARLIAAEAVTRG